MARVFTVPKFGQVCMISYPYQVSDLISQDNRTLDTASDWLIANLGTVIKKIVELNFCVGECAIFYMLNQKMYSNENTIMVLNLL